MNTAVDSSAIIAIVRGQPSGGAWMHQLVATRKFGNLLACEAVWAETRQLYPSREAHAKDMETFGVSFNPLLAPAAALAGEIQKAYRQSGGKRDRLLADFLIGAHALTQADQLATSDEGFLRNYFRNLKILEIRE